MSQENRDTSSSSRVLSRIGLVAPTAADARDVMIEGSSGIMEVCWEYDRDINDDGDHDAKANPGRSRVDAQPELHHHQGHDLRQRQT